MLKYMDKWNKNGTINALDAWRWRPCKFSNGYEIKHVSRDHKPTKLKFNFKPNKKKMKRWTQASLGSLVYSNNLKEYLKENTVISR